MNTAYHSPINIDAKRSGAEQCLLVILLCLSPILVIGGVSLFFILR